MIEANLRTSVPQIGKSRKAIDLATLYLENPEPKLRQEALFWITRSYEKQRDPIIRLAHQQVLGLPLTAAKLSVEGPSVARRFTYLAQAWMAWINGEDPLISLEAAPKKPEEFGGALQWMSLDPWEQAIRALVDQNTVEAKRFFRRSIQLGTQCQTDGNHAIRWTYVASFFHS